MEQDQIHKKVGKNLQNIRKTRMLTLDQMADVTGVSKAMLGQIERGESNPTISILWKIVNGLRISFTSLIEADSSTITHYSLQNVEPFIEQDGRYRTYPLIPFDQNKRFEIFTVEMEPGCRHTSEPHHAGVEEYILLISGQLTVSFEQQTYILNAGEALHFMADQIHTYENLSGEKVSYQAIIFYPEQQ
ncbi:helix-turn-helix domain-containing protein [Paenibacillus spongiae]|uniref:XRE family transcriptional regulator n=1 Tax=Paenibacillus spongiae TaxID=2909671 RepID=A0ABY5SIR2_9BACL|nr:XRE family transcriptional regulator [Paenibacillus spongiae]UVI33320.1 XRE family transcriptional regulator [Paenibacillus spongiae]